MSPSVRESWPLLTDLGIRARIHEWPALPVERVCVGKNIGQGWPNTPPRRGRNLNVLLLEDGHIRDFFLGISFRAACEFRSSKKKKKTVMNDVFRRKSDVRASQAPFEKSFAP